MSFAPSTVAEAEAMQAAAAAFARPHIEALQALLIVWAGDVEEIQQHVPRAMAEHADLSEITALLRRYAAKFGAVPDEAPASADQVLGVARRVAVETINRAADQAVDAEVIAVAQLLDLPVMDMPRLIDAVMAAGVALTHKRSRGEPLTEPETTIETAFQTMATRQSAIRSAQRDHVRAVDAIQDVAEAQGYPATIVWPGGQAGGGGGV